MSSSVTAPLRLSLNHSGLLVKQKPRTAFKSSTDGLHGASNFAAFISPSVSGYRLFIATNQRSITACSSVVKMGAEVAGRFGTGERRPDACAVVAPDAALPAGGKSACAGSEGRRDRGAWSLVASPWRSVVDLTANGRGAGVPGVCSRTVDCRSGMGRDVTC